MRDQQKISFARHLRRNLTDVERIVWHHVRNRALCGCKFRRQHPIGPYIVDFACIGARLIIELDGGQHGCSTTDRFRTAALEARGWRVLRFWNHEVCAERDSVLDAIVRALEETQASAAARFPRPHAGRV